MREVHPEKKGAEPALPGSPAQTIEAEPSMGHPADRTGDSIPPGEHLGQPSGCCSAESVAPPRDLRLEWWEADRLTPHPENWRRHPSRQRQALAHLLREVGWAGALLYNERTGRLLDGHLRKELASGQKVPVLVGSWSQEQERKILALLDPLSALAEADQQGWQELLSTLGEPDAALAEALTAYARQHELPLTPDILTAAEAARPVANLPAARFEVIVECPDEPTQRQLYERLRAEGWRCRVLAF